MTGPQEPPESPTPSMPLLSADDLQAVLDAIDEPVFIKGMDHRWTGCNHAFCALLGASRAAIIGHTDEDYFPPEQVKVFLRIDSKVMRTGKPAFNEESLTRSDGAVRTIYTRKYPLRDQAGNIVGLAGIITDISALVKRQQEIEQLEASLNERATTIETQRILLEQVSVPVVQVWDGILMLPLMGIIDTHRATRILEHMLDAIESHKARVLLLDMTGVPLVDTAVATYMIQSIQAASLLGCESVVVGISPHIAQTVVQLGIDLSEMTTRATLQQGLAHALHLLGYSVRR